MTDRRYVEVVTMSTSWINLGFADGRISDGTSCRIYRQPNGTWVASLRGVDVWGARATWEQAADDLEHALAAEGLLLRLG